MGVGVTQGKGGREWQRGGEGEWRAGGRAPFFFSLGIPRRGSFPAGYEDGSQLVARAVGRKRGESELFGTRQERESFLGVLGVATPYRCLDGLLLHVVTAVLIKPRVCSASERRWPPRVGFRATAPRHVTARSVSILAGESHGLVGWVSRTYFAHSGSIIDFSWGIACCACCVTDQGLQGPCCVPYHGTAVEGWALGAGRWASARQDIAALSASRPPSKRPGGRLRYWQCQSMCSPSNVISSPRRCRVPRQHYRSHPTGTGERSHVTFISLPQRDREPCSELRNVLCRVVLLR